jgi:hypothetical protein
MVEGVGGGVGIRALLWWGGVGEEGKKEKTSRGVGEENEAQELGRI